MIFLSFEVTNDVMEEIQMVGGVCVKVGDNTAILGVTHGKVDARKYAARFT